MKHYKFAVFAVLAILVVPALAVTFGELDNGAHPYVGIVVMYAADGTPLFRCSGTLLSPTVFLTAGHCTASSPGFDVDFAQVWFDDDPIPTGWPFAGGTLGDPIPHPGFDFELGPNIDTHDVGVVILRTPVPMDTYGVLAPLGTLDDLRLGKSRQSETFKNVGYGLQSIKPNFQADVIRYRSSSHIVNQESVLNIGNFQTSNNPGKGHDVRGGSCFGDSGGPVFHGDTNVIVGIVSFGLNNNCKGNGDFARRADIADTQDFVNLFLP